MKTKRPFGLGLPPIYGVEEDGCGGGGSEGWWWYGGWPEKETEECARIKQRRALCLICILSYFTYMYMSCCVVLSPLPPPPPSPTTTTGTVEPYVLNNFMKFLTGPKIVGLIMTLKV